MKKFIVDKTQIEGDIITISGGEFDHLKKVLRLSCGDEIIVLCGDGREYLCKIDSIGTKSAEAKISNISKCHADPRIKITVYQGIPKGDKFEFLIQKLSEVGVTRLVPFNSEFVVAKCKDKQERFDKIAAETCKQCGRSKPMEVGKPISFRELLKEIRTHEACYFAYEKAESGSFNDVSNFYDIAIIVGSEGGFSEKESEEIISAGAKEISLGKRILRTETASLVLAGILSYLTNN